MSIFAHVCRTGWEEVHTFPEAKSKLASVPIDKQWLMFSGNFRKHERFLMNSKGQKVQVGSYYFPGERGGCGSVVSDHGTHVIVTILGGIFHGDAMDLYNCTTGGDHPKCSRLPDGPKMNEDKRSIGCGTLTTSEVGSG